MGTEILSIPEEHLEDVILVIKSGLEKEKDNIDVVSEFNLNKWIKQHTE